MCPIYFRYNRAYEISARCPRLGPDINRPDRFAGLPTRGAPAAAASKLAKGLLTPLKPDCAQGR